MTSHKKNTKIWSTKRESTKKNANSYPENSMKNSKETPPSSSTYNISLGKPLIIPYSTATLNLISILVVLKEEFFTSLASTINNSLKLLKLLPEADCTILSWITSKLPSYC